MGAAVTEENVKEGIERNEESSSDVDEDAEEDETSTMGLQHIPPLPSAPQPSALAPLPMAIGTSQFGGQRPRSMSPALHRRTTTLQNVTSPRSYTIEAICAVAHPTPTHTLASSLCMSHLITGSEDGYVRDYDVFAGANGKTLLTAPQRAHCAVVEGTMKAGVLRYWWENPKAGAEDDVVEDEDNRRSSVTSLAMHSDALWALAGSE
ncbi:hypothetical protein SCHPADRAFT_934068, partial [Schizopora paradoxa]